MLTLEALKTRYEDLAVQLLDAETLPQWLHVWSELRKEVLEHRAKLQLAHHQDVRDSAAEAAYLKFDHDVMPQVNQAEHQLQVRLLELPTHILDQHPDLKLIIRRLQDHARVYNPKNDALEAEISAIITRFNKARSALNITLDDQTLGLHQAFTKQFVPDRKVREAAFIASENAKLSMAEDADEMMLELLNLRHSIAQNAGFTDFCAYTWCATHRYDYTPEDSKRLHDATASEVVPVLAEVYEHKCVQLNIPKMRPWDVYVDAQNRPSLQPFKTTEDLEAGLMRLIAAIDADLGHQFAEMREGWLDLETREGKLSMVGYCMPLPKSARAFIYHSMFGTHADVWIMLHEAGHAFHNIAAANAQKLIWHHQPTMEVCELASQTMELLGLVYLASDDIGIYTPEQAAQANEEQLMRCLRLIATAQADAFHHWVYSRVVEGVSAAELDEEWLELERRYNPWLDWSGLTHIACKGWQSSHVLMHPFYALEYKIAMFGALEIWQHSLVNQVGAVSKYRHMLSLGASRSLPELFEAAGATWPFHAEADHIRKLAKFLRAQLIT
ncbi:MAG: M3 family metallopeptidase [Deinococcota bacterium]